MPTERPPFYIGRYLVTGRLGSGGMGVVYLATDERLGRQVAIKRLVKNPSSSSAHRRIRQEALLLAQLNHSNIVQIYDVVEERNDVALVMEYVDGCSLTHWQRERNPGLIQKVRLLKQICSGLSRAHSIGIIHRDLKADNILIDSDNTAKIGDFGIAKNWREDSDLTREQHIAGSWGAMSPEQAQGNPLDNRSDLFSLGVLGYQLLCGQNPFGDCESPYVLIDRIVNSQHPPASKLNPELPGALSQLLDRLLAKSPAQRPLNAAAVAAELEAIAGGLENSRTGFSGSRTVTITAEDYHRRRRRKPATGRALFGIAAAASALLFVGAALAFLLPQFSSSSDGEYIALVSPPADPGQSREARILIQSVLNAIKHGLSNRDGLYLVPYSESQALRGQPLERQARALNAQLLLNPDISCGPTLCNLTLELIDSEGQFVVANRSLSLSLGRIKGGFEQTLQQVNYLLPKFPPRDRDPNLSIGEEDYRRYLELEARTFDYRTAEVTEEALDALEELREKAPLFPPIYELYGKLAYDHRYTNRKADSIERLDEFLAKAPAKIVGTTEVLGARLFLANARYDWQDAGQILAQLKIVMSDPARYHYLEAMYHHLRGDYDQALDAADKTLALRTGTTYLMQKALTLSYAGEMEAAKPYLQRVLETDSNYTDATSLLAANELDMGRTGETIRLLGTVGPDRLSALDLYNLCTAHYLEKNYGQADHCFDELYTTLPSDLEPLLYRAEIARELQRPETARQLSEHVVELNSGREGWDNQLILALAYAQLGRPETAVETLLAVRRDAPDDIYVNHIQAQVYVATEDLISTKAHIRKTLELGQSPIWYHTSRFAKICTHSGFADLRGEYPALCPGGAQNPQIARQ